MSDKLLIWSRGTLFLATLFGAILAGLTIDRYFVQRPAFEHLGAVAWGAYSRVADLGSGGLVLYAITFQATEATLLAFTWVHLGLLVSVISVVKSQKAISSSMIIQ